MLVSSKAAMVGAFGINLSIKKPYGFCLTNPQAIEDFHGSLFKADIDTGINTV